MDKIELFISKDKIRKILGLNLILMVVLYGICQLGYQLATDKGELAKQAAIDTAAINATTTAQTQKILDALAQNKIESLQAQVNQLYIDKQLCGIVRYPTSSSYASPNPFCGCGCGIGNI